MKALHCLILALTLTGCANMPPLTSAEAHRRQQQRNEAKESAIEQRKVIFIGSHPELTDEMIALIRDGKIKIGMTEDEVRASWGEGTENHSVSESGTSDQWIYHSSFVNSVTGTYLYFTNGRLTSWHDVN